MILTTNREKSLPERYIPELKAAAEAGGLDWAKFQQTDNSCPLHPPLKAPLEELADDIQGVRDNAAGSCLWA